MRIDFHTHSTASDGQYTPSQLVEMAKEKELEKFAITDHDTVEGIKEAREKALELGVDFVAGIEISTHQGEEIHILGLGINENNPKLVEECSRYKSERVGRGERICNFLTEKGIPVNLKRYNAWRGRVPLEDHILPRFCRKEAWSELVRKHLTDT